MSKTQTRLKVIRSLFQLEIVKGHLKWTVTELARKSGVSRQTIYLYFGTKKPKILEQALREICEEYFGLSEERKSLAQKDFVASALITRKLYDETPEFAVFYQTWRHRSAEYKAIFQVCETRYREKLITSKFAQNEADATRIHVMLHGLMSAPFLTEKSFIECLKEFVPYKNR